MHSDITVMIVGSRMRDRELAAVRAGGVQPRREACPRVGRA